MKSRDQVNRAALKLDHAMLRKAHPCQCKVQAPTIECPLHPILVHGWTPLHDFAAALSAHRWGVR